MLIMSDGHDYDVVAASNTSTLEEIVATPAIELEKVDTFASAGTEPEPEKYAAKTNATAGTAGSLELQVNSNNETNLNGEEYEHKTLVNNNSNAPATKFESLTQDVSFSTKLWLILWKNAKIQCLRRPKSFCVKLSLPFCIMLIMLLIKQVVELEVREAEEGYEFEYLLGGSEQAIMYQQLSSSIDTNLGLVCVFLHTYTNAYIAEL